MKGLVLNEPTFQAMNKCFKSPKRRKVNLFKMFREERLEPTAFVHAMRNAMGDTEKQSRYLEERELYLIRERSHQSINKVQTTWYSACDDGFGTVLNSLLSSMDGPRNLSELDRVSNKIWQASRHK